MYIPQKVTYTPLIAIFAIAVTGHSFSLPGQQRSGQMTRAEHGHSSYPGHAESSPVENPDCGLSTPPGHGSSGKSGGVDTQCVTTLTTR